MGAKPELTGREYTGIERAYAFFNERLFDGELPDLLITYQRKAGSCGYYSPGRFERRDGSGSVPELALNPAVFRKQTDVEILQTLGHEMAHHWQWCFGKPTRGGYHNKEWAGKMEAIGLIPSDTGQPGGRKVGPSMSDYVMPGGLFEQVCQELLAAGFRFNFQSVDCLPTAPVQADGEEGEGGEPKPRKPRQSKLKYTCPCGQNAWGKPGLAMMCAKCEGAFVGEGSA
ncbi:SprT-like domain-containing protein [Fundidesulfovibrio putealis]|uniref:SprT-like domain-containing protein n=1 Tax=Fundidesulfovibrio putealis TaxID=270496 RepID=UPI000401CE23|nr:SprT-like domain-containing protein [Fundidesulfovibrio putealis]KAF0234887.1 MAG: hypothetical protein FD177_450 [Desulfovibrionaceae bacterium]